MQFSRKFMISSAIILIAALIVWQTSARNTDEESAEVASEQQDNQDDRAQNAFKSLNKAIGGKETPILVDADPALQGTLIQKVSAQGRVHTYQKSDVINEVPGRLVKLNVRDGDRVKKGQLIAEIDEREYKLEVEQAEASYLSAQADYVTFDTSEQERKVSAESAVNVDDEMAKLDAKLKSGDISQADYDRDKLYLELEAIRLGGKQDAVKDARLLGQARISLEKARLNLSKCKIYAPYDGTIFNLEVSVGQYLNGSTKIGDLVNMDDLVIKAKVLESEVGQVFEGRPSVIKFTALPDLGDLEGEILAISPMINETDKTVDTIVRIKSKDRRIRPGMFAEVIIDSRIFEDRLMVPKLAILPRDNRKVVFKVGDDNRAKWEYVKTGVENDQFVEILEGKIDPGDLVLTDNHFTMGHDTLIKISKKK